MHLTEEKEDENTFSYDEAYAIIAGDELNSLKEAWTSPEWSTWQETMKIEIDQLNGRGTWELVPKPLDVIPITNKWVFIWKHNKMGGIVRHRAHLVARGFSQCPGYDYMETFLPVVRMDTLHAILMLASIKKLKIKQIDTDTSPKPSKHRIRHICIVHALTTSHTCFNRNIGLLIAIAH
jgi:hypothetical protein